LDHDRQRFHPQSSSEQGWVPDALTVGESRRPLVNSSLSCHPHRFPGRRALATLLAASLVTLVAGRTATAEPISFIKLDFTPLAYFQGTAHIDFLGDPPHVHDFTAGCVPLCFLSTGGPAPCGVWETPFTIGETVPRSVSLSGTSEHIIAPHAGEPACGPAFTYSTAVSVPFGGIIRDVRFTDSRAHGGHTDTHVVALAAFSFVRPGGIEKRGYVHSSMGTHRAVAGEARAAILNGPEEVPPDTSGAFGTMVLVADPSTNTISMFATVDEIPPSKILLSHIHVGPPGVSGGVVFNIGSGSLWQAFGSGSAIALVDKPFPAANMPMLLNGGCYINVHTPVFPNGEIRGQILQPQVLDVPPPTDELAPHGQLFNAPNSRSRRRRAWTSASTTPPDGSCARWCAARPWERASSRSSGMASATTAARPRTASTTTGCRWVPAPRPGAWCS
jgi:hypothetical protein